MLKERHEIKTVPFTTSAIFTGLQNPAPGLLWADNRLQSIQRELLGAEFSAANNQTRSMDLTLTRGIIKSKGSLRQIKAFHCQRHFEKFKLTHWYSSASVSLDQSPLLFFLSFFHIITAHRGLNIWHPQGYLLNFLNHLSWGGALYGAEFLPEVTPAL